MDDSQTLSYQSDTEDGTYVPNSQTDSYADASFVPNTEMDEVYSKGDEDEGSLVPDGETVEGLHNGGGEYESFVPETDVHGAVIAKNDGDSQKNPVSICDNHDVHSGFLYWESEVDGFRHNEGVDVGGGVSQVDFTYESPMYLYGPDYFTNRMKRRQGRHAKPRDPSMGFILSRNDDIPEYFKDVVAADTYDGYEGVDLKELMDDAISEDPMIGRNLGTDLFAKPNK